MTLKLDVSKAFDRAEWKFLRMLLLRLGLPLIFVELIMLSVSSSLILTCLTVYSLDVLCRKGDSGKGIPFRHICLSV